jgi:hypothetical protein
MYEFFIYTIRSADQLQLQSAAGMCHSWRCQLPRREHNMKAPAHASEKHRINGTESRTYKGGRTLLGDLRFERVLSCFTCGRFNVPSTGSKRDICATLQNSIYGALSRHACWYVGWQGLVLTRNQRVVESKSAS